MSTSSRATRHTAPRPVHLVQDGGHAADAVGRPTRRRESQDDQEVRKKGWSVKGIPQDIRELAKQAAHSQGRSLGSWLNEVIDEAARSPEPKPVEETPRPQPRTMRAPRRARPSESELRQPADQLPAEPAPDATKLVKQVAAQISEKIDTAVAQTTKNNFRMRRLTEAVVEIATRLETLEDDKKSKTPSLPPAEPQLELTKLAIESKPSPLMERPPCAPKRRRVEAQARVGRAPAQRTAAPDWGSLADYASYDAKADRRSGAPRLGDLQSESEADASFFAQQRPAPQPEQQAEQSAELRRLRAEAQKRAFEETTDWLDSIGARAAEATEECRRASPSEFRRFDREARRQAAFQREAVERIEAREANHQDSDLDDGVQHGDNRVGRRIVRPLSPEAARRARATERRHIEPTPDTAEMCRRLAETLRGVRSAPTDEDLPHIRRAPQKMEPFRPPQDAPPHFTGRMAVNAERRNKIFLASSHVDQDPKQEYEREPSPAPQDSRFADADLIQEEYEDRRSSAKFAYLLVFVTGGLIAAFYYAMTVA